MQKAKSQEPRAEKLELSSEVREYSVQALPCAIPAYLPCTDRA